MAVPVARMRLTVEVLPLEAANAHGPYRAQAIAAFKGRKFALPVQLEDTFERVWGQIEQRYKTNYLDAQQAAAFTIKKLQDAYDCDLDLGDTVSSIFEGEPDPTMRMIKVVPSFINRDFSVPVTSNLRPGYAQKRVREINEELANKRRRVEQQQLGDIQEVDPSRDQPMPTTESERSGDDGAEQSGHRSRSRTGTSLVVVKDTHTGHAEFGPGIKEESPELGLPITQKAPSTASVETTFTKPPVPISKKSPRKRKSAKSRSRTPRVPPVMIPEEQVENGVPELDDAATQNVPVQGKVAQNTHRITASPKLGSPETALHPSPKPIPGPSQETPSSAAVKRKDVYDVPSSPEFLKNKSKPKSKQTYAKSPRAANTIQKENGVQTPERTPLAKPARPGSLKKPSRNAHLEQPNGNSSRTRIASPAPVLVPKRRGRSAKSTLNNSSQTPDATPVVEPATKQEAVQFVSQSTSSKSSSTSAANSTRSSPAITRRPARFLSHSPTPEASDSGDESDGISAAASKATTPPLPEENSNEIESDSSSDSDESGAEDEDIEMPDVPAQAEPQFTAVDESAVPSSPPRLAIVPNSTPLVPETSQPTTSQLNPSTIRRTPVPLPPPSQLRSSQSVSVHAAARRPATRYAGFRTLREQLADAQKTPTATQTKAYDPRTMSLGKLAAKAKGRSKGFVGVGNNDGSSEEDSSSSSSDSD
ncbi:uncharacterized protein K460DRAFT_338882 [Cucurbitaria berberidis CBS 394.84]|uniref:Nucleolar protein Dnt1-like N-terminal domain-containing protein n=1 Tax=Cucurbitaria berberidis CBS 394.84 TaxID=1168544 RepID=A0A9P4GI57_9PLEO|nr:uncharacterized protein K460DRAFT_338882 [Cucurbitaria berberidis CBS 394.84]KAF1846030.1 hypothetical protein K460DRAFT_338882 [Cucurbitaria berberidis CBS 394.84]